MLRPFAIWLAAPSAHRLRKVVAAVPHCKLLMITDVLVSAARQSTTPAGTLIHITCRLCPNRALLPVPCPARRLHLCGSPTAPGELQPSDRSTSGRQQGVD